MPYGRNEYTREEDEFLARYLAEQTPSGAGRSGNKVYEQLCENPKKWPLAKYHTWHSWRNRYNKNQEWFEKMIRKYQKDRGLGVTPFMATPSSKPRKNFTQQEDQALMEYIARHSSEPRGRTGNNLYVYLCDNTDKFRWAKNHPVQSWRQRYKDNKEEFDKAIADYQDSADFKFVKDMTGFQGSQVSRFSSFKPRSRASTGSPTPSTKTNAKGKERRAEVRPEAVPSKKRTRDEIGNDRADEERTPKRTRPAHLLVASSSRVAIISDNEGSETEDEDDVPPGSDDYQGEIFEEEESEHEAESEAIIAEEENVHGEARDSGDETAAPMQPPSTQRTPQSPYLPLTYRAAADDATRSTPKPDPISEQPEVLPGTLRREQSRGITPVQAEVVDTASTLPMMVEPDSQAVARPNTPTAKAPERNDFVPPQEPQEHAPRASSAATVEYSQSQVWAPPSDFSLAAPITSTPKANAHRRKPPKRRGEDSDFFASSPPAPSQDTMHESVGQTSQRMRAPPRLIDGPFISAFTDAQGRPQIGASGSGSHRRISGIPEEDEDDAEGAQSSVHESPVRVGALQQSWPPTRRSKGKGKMDAHAFERTASPRPQLVMKSRADLEPKQEQQEITRVPQFVPRDHHAFSQPTQALIEVATAAPVQQREHHPFSQLTQALPRVNGTRCGSKARSAAGSTGLDLGVIEKALEKAMPSRRELHFDEESIVMTKAASTPGPAIRSESPFKVPAVPIRPSISDPESVAARSAQPHAQELIRQATVVSKSLDKGKQKAIEPIPTPSVAGPSRRRSQTAPGHDKSSADVSYASRGSPLRQHQSAPLSKPRTSVTSLDTSVSLPKPPASEHRSVPALTLDVCDSLPGHERLMAVRVMLQRMAENHGFSEEMATTVLLNERSLERTDFVLGRMRESAERTALDMWQAYDEEPPLDDEPQVSSMEYMSSVKILQRDARHRPSSLAISGLKYTPMVNHGGEPVVSPTYIPPRSTRARKHWRRSSDVTSDNSRTSANASTYMQTSFEASPARPEVSQPIQESVRPAPSTPRATTP
ncbi:hypothetical protein CERSUDRAFT_117137, partial [Gelatoporia subvermispora B]